MQGRFIQRLELCPATAGQFLKRPGVEFFQQLTDGRIEFGQGEEGPVTQHRQDPALDHQYPGFYLGLVTRATDTGRQYRDAIMGGHVLVGGIGIGFITMGLGHAGT